jgi:tRNA nucleotidyltransferase (CCA-adding enzyme)
MYLINFESFFSPLQWQVILAITDIARDLNLRAFAVGGIVRDAILNQQKEQDRQHPFPKDLDLVFDGAFESGITGAGIKVAIALHQLFPETKLQVHEKFQTAEIHWQASANHHEFAIDLATARREVYAYAGANPQVEATTIDQDLYRRDFTINALAVQLDREQGTKGEVIDQFDGLADLARRQVRAIRQGSFVEDPRRLFRVVRFAIRLDLAIAIETSADIIATTSSGIHDAIGGARLRSELLYTLAEPKSAQMFAVLQDLDILRCIDPTLRLPQNLANSFKHQWRRSQYWLNCLKRQHQKSYEAISSLTLGLELLLSYVSPAIAIQIDLGLTPEQKNRFTKLSELVENAPKLLKDLPKVSIISQYFQKFDTQTLIIAAMKLDMTERRSIWNYLTQWQMIKSPLTGSDLKNMGYPSGKQMGEILQNLRSAQLDGVISDRESAIVYLNRHFKQ